MYSDTFLPSVRLYIVSFIAFHMILCNFVYMVIVLVRITHRIKKQNALQCITIKLLLYITELISERNTYINIYHV